MSKSESSFGFQSKDIEKSLMGSGPKENLGDTRERKVFAISAHSSSFDDVCFMIVEAKA